MSIIVTERASEGPSLKTPMVNSSSSPIVTGPACDFVTARSANVVTSMASVSRLLSGVGSGVPEVTSATLVTSPGSASAAICVVSVRTGAWAPEISGSPPSSVHVTTSSTAGVPLLVQLQPEPLDT